MMRSYGFNLVLLAALSAVGAVVESERELPVVHETDVLVVGASSGAVTAALKAHESGAKVFLVAPRPYLGEDMAGKLRLSLGPNDDTRSPILKKIFAPLDEGLGLSLPFSYKTDVAAAPAHKDFGGKMLSDGKYQHAPTQSVEFGSDVTITLDLGKAVDVSDVNTAIFVRESEGGFSTAEIRVERSEDGETWTAFGSKQGYEQTSAPENALVKVTGQGRARYLKLTAIKAPNVPRQLLGEIVVRQAGGISEDVNVLGRTTPLRVKKSFDDALLQAGIPFLTGAHATEPLVDASGKLAGVVIANRSGRQAIKAKVVIDATERGIVARRAGAQVTPFHAGTYTFKRLVVAGEAPRAEGVRVKELFGVYDAHITGIKAPKGMPSSIKGRMFECSIDLPMRDGSARSFAEAEQKARDLTFVATQLEGADTLFLVPPDRVKGVAPSRATWGGVAALEMDAFRAVGVENLFVLSGLADISRSAAQELMSPGNLMATGERLGAEAAKVAAQRGAVGAVRVAGNTRRAGGAVTVSEHSRRLPTWLANVKGSIKAEAYELPLLAECDVFVAGAGTGGGPAGIAAAQQGAKTIICDYLYQMGGVQTDGLIGKYYYGNRVGFTQVIDDGVAQTGAVFSQCKSEWYRAQNRKGGAEVWYGTMVTGVVTEGGRVTGVVVVMPDGTRGVVRCKVALDGTGNAELAALAGEKTEFITAAELALQGVGQTPRNMGASYTNTDIGFLDDTDAADLFFFALRSRVSMPDSVWDQAQVINSRERRRLIGAFYMSPLDVANERTYPDVITQTASNFDSHGFTVHEQFFIEDPGHHRMMVNLPLRCLLPERLENLMVLGLGISAHRDAMPILRMQPDVQNQGYAAGVAAAMAIKAGVTVRNVDIRALQKHLIKVNILPASVLQMKDSFPLSDANFESAIKSLTDNYKGLAVILTDTSRALPLLRQAYNAAQGDDRLVYAHVLAILGHADGEKELIEKVKSMEWDKGWNFRGMGQFNRSVSWVDSYIIALGRARSRAALPVLREKADALTLANEFSHYRAIALAFEAIGEKTAAGTLAALLRREGVQGYAIAMGADIPVIKNYANIEGDKERSECLRELSLARALYNLGDDGGVGERVLRAYANDPRGAYATHAKLVLGEAL